MEKEFNFLLISKLTLSLGLEFCYNDKQEIITE